MELTGKSIIGYSDGASSSVTFTAFDPRSGEAVAPDFYSASLEELNRAISLAESARLPLANLAAAARAEFLRTIAANIESLGETLPARASLETSLPVARFEGERARTCFQLRMFAELIERGDWVDARLDRPDATRQPLPKPDVRSMLRPLGPVAVFCAGNFPLAYSVAGGDTASALAAGCPVIVNAHFAHPGTAELVGHAVRDAARSCGMPDGVFSLIFSKGYEIGQALVRHPQIRAVGFTGSRTGGRALMDIAAARPEPIPVYAEMSSVNPIFILPSALRERRTAIAQGLHGSVTTGAGQFCTKPGLVFLPAGSDAESFLSEFEALIRETPAQSLLTSGICANFGRLSGDRPAASVQAATQPVQGYGVNASFFLTTSAEFLTTPTLADEVFGPTTLFITYPAESDLPKLASTLEGQLTATIHGTSADLANHEELLQILETKAGRLIFNGFPTGVEVGAAIVHGGPYPATSDSRTSAVGTRAIERFCRYVCWQNFPDESLPAELQNENPRGISRLIDGQKPG